MTVQIYCASLSCYKSPVRGLLLPRKVVQCLKNRLVFEKLDCFTHSSSAHETKSGKRSLQNEIPELRIVT